ncbi:FAD-dependent oxidoreductase [Paenibacillus sp. HWE-109]|uniref:FAD-dependent oxidoreductase n=1 Tax=Paenibacillus sp. HWE-109 TaxID=1306526 RepID=UPI001EE0D257|nr:FAD-dependent oxidoreductase [Paenibacillus sp. HWE-109]UKS28497.1 FAD-dependent oxidoreductase [Paenibacillus sp. HWE-109]
MNDWTNDFDIVIVGAGVGGICAALAASRLHSKVLLIEKMSEIGGTGVHAAIALVCKFRDHDGRCVNTGIHKELFPQAYQNTGLTFDEETVSSYDEQELKETYHRLIQKEKNLTVWTDCEVDAVQVEDGNIRSVTITGSKQTRVFGRVFLDATADGNLSALAGAEFQKGREKDGKMQMATVTFKLTGFDPSLFKVKDVTSWGCFFWLEETLKPYYMAMKQRTNSTNMRQGVLAFPYPDGKAFLFNSTAVNDVDPTIPGSVERAFEIGKAQVYELVEAIREHPAFREAKIETIFAKLGVREGRRVIGDYMLTGEDCLQVRKFDDMVAACAYDVDVHDPDGNKNHQEYMTILPSPGYYHIPYRSLIAKGFGNLLLSSRCISGTFEAHASYRVMSGISAIGEAAGTAAALTVKSGFSDVRMISAEEIRYILQTRGQFVEGAVKETHVLIK